MTSLAVRQIVDTHVRMQASAIINTLANAWLQEDADQALAHFTPGKPRQDRKALSDLSLRANEVADPFIDYETAARAAGWDVAPAENPNGASFVLGTAESFCHDWADLCASYEIEPAAPAVALDHFVVTSWLADQLAAKGQVIHRDFAGLHLWTRASTLPIEQDEAILAIAEEMKLDEDTPLNALGLMYAFAGSMAERHGMNGDETMTDEDHKAWQEAAGTAAVALQRAQNPVHLAAGEMLELLKDILRPGSTNAAVLEAGREMLSRLGHDVRG
jgi:hypothetical protein